MMTDLNLAYSDKRTGENLHSESRDARSEFQRDYDRIIFSAAFRRLQNKTQVFPLPGSVFVHNRLTHSLEVSSVGRSLGSLVGKYIVEKYAPTLTEASKDFYNYSLYNVISAACLCHDIGNPAFGHSGEDAIANYFVQNIHLLQDKLSPAQLQDLTQFEGNSNAIRLLTQQQNGKSKGGLMLTFSTLASIAKYPCESLGKNKQYTHRKKFGFFQSEKEIFEQIALNTQMPLEENNPTVYKRHPFVWLTEAADDICYNIIDLEDAHRLGIISHNECQSLLLDLANELQRGVPNNITKRLENIQDKNDQISYLRAKIIGTLINHCVAHYAENFESIFSGTHNKPLLALVAQECPMIKHIETYSVENIYNHHSVIEIENAGYNVLSELLQHFIPPILKNSEARSGAEKKALQLIPNQFIYDYSDDYTKILGILDFVSGMTDNFAMDLYRKIKGIDVGLRQ